MPTATMAWKPWSESIPESETCSRGEASQARTPPAMSGTSSGSGNPKPAATRSANTAAYPSPRDWDCR